ncbi:MAG: hypothetical protein WAL04_00320 [Acidimicrobiales bacterium]
MHTLAEDELGEHVDGAQWQGDNVRRAQIGANFDPRRTAAAPGRGVACVGGIHLYGEKISPRSCIS